MLSPSSSRHLCSSATALALMPSLRHSQRQQCALPSGSPRSTGNQWQLQSLHCKMIFCVNPSSLVGSHSPRRPGKQVKENDVSSQRFPWGPCFGRVEPLKLAASGWFCRHWQMRSHVPGCLGEICCWEENTWTKSAVIRLVWSLALSKGRKGVEAGQLQIPCLSMNCTKK